MAAILSRAAWPGEPSLIRPASSKRRPQSDKTRCWLVDRVYVAGVKRGGARWCVAPRLTQIKRPRARQH